MTMKYAFNDEMNDNMSRAYGSGLGISTKQAVEVCNFIRGKGVERAKTMLERIIKKELAVPMKRFNQDTAHKKGIAAGRYPVRTAEGILSVIESAEANAQNKGLSTKDMVIDHISAHKAARPWHYGRKKRSKMKRTHIQVVLLEKKIQKKEQKTEEKQETKI